MDSNQPSEASEPMQTSESVDSTQENVVLEQTADTAPIIADENDGMSVENVQTENLSKDQEASSSTEDGEGMKSAECQEESVAKETCAMTCSDSSTGDKEKEEEEEEKLSKELMMNSEENSSELPQIEEINTTAEDPGESSNNLQEELDPFDAIQDKVSEEQNEDGNGNEMISEPDRGIEEAEAEVSLNNENNTGSFKVVDSSKLMGTTTADDDNNKDKQQPEEKQMIKLKSQKFLMDPASARNNVVGLGDADGVSVIAAEESILPEEQEKDDRYAILHSNHGSETACEICDAVQKPLYVAQKGDDTSLYLCSNDCLETFKQRNPDKFVERMIRLRAFAQEPELMEQQQQQQQQQLEQADLPPLHEFEEERDDRSTDDSRKCRTCRNLLDLDSYVSWEAQDYCCEGCLIKFQRTINMDCACCLKRVPDTLVGKYCVRFGTTITQFCRTTCLLNHKKKTKFCAYCQENLHVPTGDKAYCSKRCAEVGNPNPKRMLESAFCAVCHQLKIFEIKVRVDSKVECICSDRCFLAYKFVNNCADLIKCIQCPTHFAETDTESIIYDGRLVYLLCSKECQKIFLISNRKIVNCANCSVKKYDFDMIKCYESDKVTFACSNHCLEEFHGKAYAEQVKRTEPNVAHLETVSKDVDFVYDGKSLRDIIRLAMKESKVPVEKVTITKARQPPKMKNLATMCRPHVKNKSTQAFVDTLVTRSMQTDEKDTFLLPIPVPIFVPVPLHLYATYIPMPTPIPIPLPIPIFIPTARKSMKGIQKEIVKIKNRMPTDPLEAEILMMADYAAGDKKEASSSESDENGEETVAPKQQQHQVMPAASVVEPIESNLDPSSTSFGDDVLSMALNQLTTELAEPVDLEGVVDHSTITSSSSSSRMVQVMETKRKQMRHHRQLMKQQQQAGGMELEKPDANMVLKYTFGVNAWKQWAALKNIEMQKSQQSRKVVGKFIKTELLHLTAEELCASLCSFINEVRKPNGTEYAPDTIYYLCLGIQQYLYENGRIDNLFCDPFYEKFTQIFDDICLKFAHIYDDTQFIVTRVEEEHLWESKQLGAHSPLVLLNTLMFFNTKHFNLTTADEHLQLSFSHIMKHWKRNPNAPGTRNVLLRFYPPQSSQDAASGKKRRVYEQHEYFENPLRCPVRLYEFYMSKCPESVKSRSDVFYLQPERSCVPDSPVWYSTIPFDKDHLGRMLNRIKMIKEINVALMAT